MHFHIAPGKTPAGQTVVLRNLMFRESCLFFLSLFCDLSGDDLHFAPGACTDAAADTDKIDIQISGAIEKRLFAGAGSAAPDRFKINGKQ